MGLRSSHDSLFTRYALEVDMAHHANDLLWLARGVAARQQSLGTGRIAYYYPARYFISSPLNYDFSIKRTAAPGDFF
jgi:hypothetical protein